MPLMVAAVALWIGMSPARSEDFPSKEYQVKAACLFNFTKFVEFPPNVFPNDSAPIAIGVLGEDPFGPLLDGIIKGETLHNRKLVVLRSKQTETLKTCQILFISKSEQSRLSQILASLGEASILSVGEVDGFAIRGGIVNFYLDDNKIRFEINPDAAKRRGIKISSKLLSLARIVQ